MTVPSPPPAWHALSRNEVLQSLAADEHGLSEAEARARLEQFGKNELPHRRPPTFAVIFLHQFQSPLIYVLGAAAALSLVMQHFSDAGFIAAILFLNAVVGAAQEWKAERSAQALQQLLKIRAAVERDGEVAEIDADQVVPGDVVWIESGNRVPADLRLLDAHSLEIDESLLTGESLPVHKDCAWQGAADAPLADRLNMAYAGAIVSRGRGRGVVVATGMQTSVGELALEVIGGGDAQPPLIERMERFSRAIALIVLGASLVVMLIGILVHGRGVLEMALFAVALAVSAIPESLPVAMTVALAVATTRMARRGVIVRKLAAVEGLGSCTLVATDKTGTLTCNELTVREIFLPDGVKLEATGEGFDPTGEVRCDGRAIGDARRAQLRPLARAAVLCNEADLHHRDSHGWAWHGDAVDIAFLALAHKIGVQREPMLEHYPALTQIPFEPERQFAASFHADESHGTLVLVKGSPERVLAMCAAHDAQRADWLAVTEHFAQSGYRVLALAEGRLAQRLAAEAVPPEPDQLEFLGFAAMIDPLRPGVREAVAACQRAGVRVCMVTGDHRVTALAIARDLGFAAREDEVMTGGELAQLSSEELAARIDRISVFARVAPQQKLQIVEAAQRAGGYVAVTGDGVNDAPALRNSNIGVAMGRSGTDVAREAAEMVLSDDNFSTVVAGIEEGRVAYDNVRKVIYLLISAGAAEILFVALAVLVGTPLPLLTVQLLWLNLVTNGIQTIALAFEPAEGDVLRRKPRPPGEPIFNQLMIERTIIAALVMGLVGFAHFIGMLQLDDSAAGVAAAQNSLLLLMVLFENFHIGNCRSETQSAFVLSPLRSPYLLLGTLGALLLHIVAMYTPFFQRLIATQPVTPLEWLWHIALALTVLVAIEIHKWTWRWRHPEIAYRAEPKPSASP